MKKTLIKATQHVDPRDHITFVRRQLLKKTTLHLHDFYELELILEGEGEQNLNGTTYSLQPGCFYLVTPIDFHSVKPADRLLIANISFDETVLSPAWQLLFANRRKDLFGAVQGAEQARLETLFSMLEQELGSGNAYTKDARHHLLELLLIAVARNLSSTESSLSLGVQQSMQYIFQHFRDDLTLSHVAAESGYEPHYFSTLFHKETGRCLTDFLADMRINYAKMLLVTSELPMAVISQKSGFGSESTFFRLFRQRVGCTPTQYRKHEEA